MFLGVSLAYKKYIDIHALSPYCFTIYVFFSSCTILIQHNILKYKMMFGTFKNTSPHEIFHPSKTPMEVSGKHGLRTVNLLECVLLLLLLHFSQKFSLLFFPVNTRTMCGICMYIELLKINVLLAVVQHPIIYINVILYII